MNQVRTGNPREAFIAGAMEGHYDLNATPVEVFAYAEGRVWREFGEAGVV